jgi:site-specific DNA-methyltransferase (adenine-specific)
MQTDLFEFPKSSHAPNQEGCAFLEQYFTPDWAAEALLEIFSLSSTDKVIDPGTGRAAFLKAIPEHIEAIGVELDPQLAALAAERSGRKVLNMDITKLSPQDLPWAPTAFIGNPPFSIEIVRQILAKAKSLFQIGNIKTGRLGLLLPAHTFQLSRSCQEIFQDYHTRVDLIPRDLFPKLSVPITFAQFELKSSRRLPTKLQGLALYTETASTYDIVKELKWLLQDAPTKTPTWDRLTQAALRSLGGEGDLSAIYRAISPLRQLRPEENPHWQEKVRQTVQRGKAYERTARGKYKLAA